MNKNVFNILCVIGSVLLFAGSFCPFVNKSWQIGTTNYLSFSGGILNLVLAITVLILIIKKSFKYLRIIGVIALVLLITTVVKFNLEPKTHKPVPMPVQRITREGKKLPNVYASSELLKFNKSYHYDWGIFVVIAGSLLLITVPFLSEKIASRQSNLPDTSD